MYLDYLTDNGTNNGANIYCYRQHEKYKQSDFRLAKREAINAVSHILHVKIRDRVQHKRSGKRRD